KAEGMNLYNLKNVYFSRSGSNCRMARQEIPIQEMMDKKIMSKNLMESSVPK
ncbi:MAG: hypothetical protein MHPSP_000981, partial [Paramarteilia canceri]